MNNIISIWEYVKANEGKTFYTVKGLEFTYVIYKNSIIPSRQKSRYPLHQKNFDITVSATPQKLADVPSSVRGQSYVFPIVKEYLSTKM